MIMDALIDPILNADIYRNMTAADRPPVLDKNLQFILLYNEKTAILGGSNMTDCYWRGSVWYYTDTSDFDRDKAYAIKTESGVCDGAFLKNDKFVVSEDSGALRVLGLVEVADTDTQELQCLGDACQHDDSLLTLSVFSDNEHIVTGGMDYCIKVWDVMELISIYTFRFAHLDIVTGVDVQPRSDSVFVSTSLDCEALMWDVRQPKPAHSILKKDIGLTAVNWNTIMDHIIAIGASDGNITVIDTRNTGTPVLQESNLFSRPIHKLLFNPNTERSEELAACCDDTIVKVLDINRDFSLVYKNDSHKDFVRGLTWCKDELLSCSWDNTVIRHVVHSCDDQ